MNKKRALRQFRELQKIVKNKAGGMRLAAEGWDADWKLLLATIMSARSRDETTIPAAEKLFEKYNSLKKVADASLGELDQLIKPINFYKNKAKAVKECAKILIDKYGGKVPHDFDKLVELPGVGRKTANVFLSEKGDDAIAVDTHCFYIARKLGWSDGKTPEKVEEDLEKLFPKRLWSKINPVLVRIGKSYLSRKKKDEVLEMVKKI